MNWKFWKNKNNNYNPQGRIGYFRKNNYPWFYTVIVEELSQVNDRSKIKIIDFKVDLDCTKSIKLCKKHFSFDNGHYMLTDTINWETAEQQYRRSRNISEEHFTHIEQTPEYNFEPTIVRGHNTRHLTPHNFVGDNNMYDEPMRECEAQPIDSVYLNREFDIL